MAIVRFEHVVKSLPQGFWLRRKPVLRDVTLSVQRGEVYGFLGPNGAGKTTSMKCLLGLLSPDQGTIEIFGRPGHEPAAREKLGYLPEHPYFYPHLTGRELIDYFGRLFGIPGPERRRRTEELLDRVGMARRAEQPLRQLSKGMMQRIGLAQALINRPDLVILDEPMSGLDPIGRREMKDIILSLRDAGTTIFFSSHILGDAEALCDRVGLLFNGRVLRESTVEDLLDEHVEYWEVACENLLPAQLPGYEPHANPGGRLYFRFDEDDRLDRWVDVVRRARGRVVLVAPHRRTLEEYFVNLARVGAEPSPRSGVHRAGAAATDASGAGDARSDETESGTCVTRVDEDEHRPRAAGGER
jgi:ABC-2 type transport system ATP-binding protein